MQTTPLKSVSETLRKSGDRCLVLKCGGGHIFYVKLQNNELVRTKNAGEAIAFDSHEHASTFVSVAMMDTRNAKTLGANIATAPLTKK